MNLNIGTSLLETDKIDIAKDITEKAKSKKAKLILPEDNKIADKFDNNANATVADYDKLPDG